MAKINVLIAHSKEDAKFKDQLVMHLSSQKEDGKTSFWDRDSILAGSDENKEIADALKKADIILLLLSANFFNSALCLAIERKALTLEKSKKVTIVPVILRHFFLGSKYDARTTIPNRKWPISGKHWHSEDEAFNFVAGKIIDIIDDRIEGKTPSHLKRPSIFKIVYRKLKRPTGILLYLLILTLGAALLLMPKRNLSVEMKLVVSQVDFQLIENRGNGLWAKSIFAKNAKIKNFDSVKIPGKKLRFLNQPLLVDIPDSRIKINPLVNSVEPNLYLTDVYLSEWHISDSSYIQLRLIEGKSLFIAVDKGRSNGSFHFNDSLELYTESSVFKLGDTEYNKDLEVMIYSSTGRVNFEYPELYHSITLDSLEENVDATNLHVKGLQFVKDLRNDSGTPLSSILSGEIKINGFDPIFIDNAETYFLKFTSVEPLRIQKINVLDNSIELLIYGEKMKEIEKGTTMSNLESEMPTILEWLTTKYKLSLLAGFIALLLPLLNFGVNLVRKKAS